MGNFIVAEQIVGVVCMVLGVCVLIWCARMDRRDFAKRRDPKEKWSFIDGEKDEEVTKQKVRGFILMLVGAGLSMFGLAWFLWNIQINK